MPEQTYETHRRLVAGYHFVLLPLTLVVFLGALYNVYRAWGRGHGRLDAGLLLLLAVCMVLAVYYARMFPLKAQDRLIQLEESVRHERLYGKPLDPALDQRQVIALRFASDGEFGELAAKAAAEGLSENRIKKSIESWRGDDFRV